MEKDISKLLTNCHVSWDEPVSHKFRHAQNIYKVVFVEMLCKCLHLNNCTGLPTKNEPMKEDLNLFEFYDFQIK